MRILLVEDDRETADFLSKKLSEAQHDVEHVSDGAAGLARALSNTYDVMIVDRLLPDSDGLSLVREARAGGVSAHVLFLTGLSSAAERVAGLNGGGDDYVVKPFSHEEIIARINALARRNAVELPALQIGDLVLDRIRRHARRGGDLIDLQHREFQILEFLMLNAGRVVTRAMILEQIWRINFDPRTNIVESHLSRIRSKIDRGGDPALIHTIRGGGYVIRNP